jgi:hypothetical protein
MEWKAREAWRYPPPPINIFRVTDMACGITAKLPINECHERLSCRLGYWELLVRLDQRLQRPSDFTNPLFMETMRRLHKDDANNEWLQDIHNRRIF